MFFLYLECKQSFILRIAYLPDGAIYTKHAEYKVVATTVKSSGGI